MPIDIIIDSSNPNKGKSNLTDSTDPTKKSSIVESKKIDATTDKSLLSVEDVQNTVKNTVLEQQAETPKTVADGEREAAKLFKTLLTTNMTAFKQEHFLEHNMLFFKYDAKDKENTYDKTPLVLILRKTKGYVLGLNLHWTPVNLRLILLKLILKLNKNNIKQNLPLQITYKMLKPILIRLNLGPVIRLYIYNRISRRGIVVPPEYWLIAARIRAESFSGGFSADKLYRMAITGFKDNKTKSIKKNKAVYKS
jgi:hypothetical protein